MAGGAAGSGGPQTAASEPVEVVAVAEGVGPLEVNQAAAGQVAELVDAAEAVTAEEVAAAAQKPRRWQWRRQRQRKKGATESVKGGDAD